jgi:hypothetical protein
VYYWTLYRVDAGEAWREGLLPALTAARDTGIRPVHAPTAQYSDWMLVADTPAAAIRAQAPLLRLKLDPYDPFDIRGRYMTVMPEARIGERAWIDFGPQGLNDPRAQGVWVLPLDIIAPGGYKHCRWRDSAFCVVVSPTDRS